LSGSGILYVVGGEAYQTEALTSVRSSLRFNRVPHVMLSDCERLPSIPDELFEARRYDPGSDPFAEKVRNLGNSPFERTIFLDSDTYVTEDLTHLFALLDRFDIAVAFAPGYRGREDPEVPRAFYEFNTGVIVWRANRATEDFMVDWIDTYLQLTEQRPFPTLDFAYGGYEQPAFRRCAWRRDVRICVLGPEYNYRPRRPGSAVERIRVIHGRYPDYEPLDATLNARLGTRSFQGIAGASKTPIVDLPPAERNRVSATGAPPTSTGSGGNDQ
jgi:hypothetical protein